MDGWVDGWMDGWMGGWTNKLTGRQYNVFVCMCTCGRGRSHLGVLVTSAGSTSPGGKLKQTSIPANRTQRAFRSAHRASIYLFSQLFLGKPLHISGHNFMHG